MFFKEVNPLFSRVILPIHLLLCFAVIWFFSSAKIDSWPYFWAIIPLWFIFSCLGISIGYHRFFSHRAFETWRPIKLAMLYLGIYACQGSPIPWSAVHRGIHHPQSDLAADLHSPKQHGFFHAFIGWIIFFDVKKLKLRNVLDLARDPDLKFVTKYYYRLFWIPVILVAFINWKFFLFALVPACVLSTHVENVVNSLCHYSWFGYRNYDLNDQSTNNMIFGWLVWGSGFHNNHHKRPNHYNFGHRSGEFDLCALIVPLISKRKNTFNENSNRKDESLKAS